LGYVSRMLRATVRRDLDELVRFASRSTHRGANEMTINGHCADFAPSEDSQTGWPP